VQEQHGLKTEEERRLLYVAITRGQEQVVVTGSGGILFEELWAVNAQNIETVNWQSMEPETDWASTETAVDDGNVRATGPSDPPQQKPPDTSIASNELDEDSQAERFFEGKLGETNLGGLLKNMRKPKDV
jgi:ATP-dependent exoDNAse (exonuclease V) beta subunit